MVYDGRWKSIAKRICEKYKIKDNSRILQINCEKGFLLNDLQELNPKIKIYGLESSKYAIDNALPSVKNFINYSDKINLEFGDNFFNSILSYFVKKLIRYPPLYVAYSISVLKKKGYEVTYENDVNLINNVDLCLVTSSIVCHETELEVLKKLKKREIYTGVIGSFCTTVPDLYIKESDFVISGEPEFFLLREDITILI